MARRIPPSSSACTSSSRRRKTPSSAKLERAKLGESERQLRDVQTMLDAAGGSLDLAYTGRWLDDLGVRELWKRLQRPQGAQRGAC